MTAGLAGTLEAAAGEARRYPARHLVEDAVLVLGGERVAVVVKRVRRRRFERDGRTRAERSLAVAQALAAAGIGTPEPMGVEVTPEESVFVARRLEGAAQVREWFLHRDDPARFPAPALPFRLEDVVDGLGRLARRLHDAGVFFRDFTDGNVLLTAGEAGEPRFWLVDLDRARIQGRPLGWTLRMRDLARPGLNRREDRARLLAAYCAPRPAPAWLRGCVTLLRERIVLWDALKRTLRPWRR